MTDAATKLACNGVWKLSDPESVGSLSRRGGAAIGEWVGREAAQ